MKFSLFNACTDPNVTPVVMQAIATACQRQLFENYAVMWQAAGVPVEVVDTFPPGDDQSCVVTILDNADQANALGYHATLIDGRPFARIFVEPIVQNGGSYLKGALALSVTCSHEILEAYEDPYTAAWYDGPDGRQYALEVCDPVEGDSYEIDGVAVSNFVGPRWFDAGGPGPFDWMGTTRAPYTMAPGGYMIVRDPGGQATQVFGEAFPGWKKPLKQRIHRRAA